MTVDSVQNVPQQNLQNIRAPLVLAEGSEVFVRVISDSSDGRALVSVAGNRINVQSREPLLSGQSFAARVHVSEGGSIELTRLPSPASSDAGAGMHGLESLYALLESEGFVPDAVSARIFQFMYQSGLKIDGSIMTRARRTASRHPGREEKAAEIAALLLEEGIEPEDGIVQALLDMCEGLYERDGNGRRNSENGKEEPEPEFLKKLYGTSIPDKAGLLTYLNQVKGGRNHWIFLPYEWKGPLDDGHELDAGGMIRLLLDTEAHSLKKMQINCKTGMTNYFFVLYYNGISDEKEVRFFTLPPLLPSAVKAEELRLGGFFSSGMSQNKPVTVTYSDSAYFDGLCATDEVPPLIQERI